MRALTPTRAIAVVCTGLAAGVLLGHRMGVSFAMPELSPSSFIQLQQIIHSHFARMMPILMLGAVGASVAWATLLRARWREVEFWLVALAAMALTGAVVLTLVVNVPINDQLMRWSSESPPARLMELWRPWETAHSLRTALAIAAFTAEVVALSAFASSPRRLHVADYGIRERKEGERRGEKGREVGKKGRSGTHSLAATPK